MSNESILQMRLTGIVKPARDLSLPELLDRYISHIDWTDPSEGHPCAMQWNEEAFYEVCKTLDETRCVLEDKNKTIENLETKVSDAVEGIRTILLWPHNCQSDPDFLETLPDEIRKLEREFMVKG